MQRFLFVYQFPESVGRFPAFRKVCCRGETFFPGSLKSCCRGAGSFPEGWFADFSCRISFSIKLDVSEY